MGLFEELVWTRKEPGFSTKLGSCGSKGCDVLVTFEHPSTRKLCVRIDSTPHTSPGWADRDLGRMSRLYVQNMYMWQYVNAVARQQMRIRTMMEKHVAVQLVSPYLNTDTIRHLLEFI